MSILSSIKEDRKLSFNHWRYRILHWAFNVENPKKPEDTGLPKYLYTHYCPLFHLTNLIALLSVFILIFKVMFAIGRAFIWAFGSVEWSKALILISWIKLPEFPKAPFPPPPTPEELKLLERTKMVEHLICYVGEFKTFWASWGSQYPNLGEEDAQKVFDAYMPKILEARESREKRKQMWKDRLVFWTNFSRVFFKWGMNLFYIALAAGLLYVGYHVAEPIVSFVMWVGHGIWWFFTEFDFASSLTFIWFLTKIFFAILVVVAAVALLARIGWIQAFLSLCWSGLSKINLPGYLLGILWGWVCAGCRNTSEFVAMFYEENCPPIILVSPEDEAVDKIEKGEEQ